MGGFNWQQLWEIASAPDNVPIVALLFLAPFYTWYAFHQARENDRLIGMITDRDIAIRGVAAGKGPDTPVRDVMSTEVKYCFEDEDVAHVAENMAELQVRRLPVMNRNKRLVGIVSLADLATEASLPKTAKALHGISQPGGQHSQSA